LQGEALGAVAVPVDELDRRRGAQDREGVTLDQVSRVGRRLDDEHGGGGGHRPIAELAPDADPAHDIRA